MKHLLAVVLLALSGLRCGTDENNAGPCVHIYEEPVLNILSVNDRFNGHRLPSVWIKQVVLDTTELNLLALRQGVSVNVSYSDSGLYCIPPFGFGTERGLYALSLSAEGYHDTVMSIAAAYAVFHGGCPSSNTGGTKIVVQMRPL